MSIESKTTEDPVRLSLLQAIQTLQQDQLKVLQILGTLINGMEALDHRLKKLEAGRVRDEGDEDTNKK